MAFVSEDGTGLSNANSYITVAYADAYFSDRGVAAWTGSNEQKQNYLIRASDYIDLRFGPRFIGCKKVATQALSWPRIVNGVDTFPEAIKKAVCEYALRAISAALAPDPQIHASGQAVTAKEEKVGPIEETTRFSQWASNNSIMMFRPYPAADALLGPWVYYVGRVIH